MYTYVYIYMHETFHVREYFFFGLGGLKGLSKRGGDYIGMSLGYFIPFFYSLKSEACAASVFRVEP